MEFVNLSLNVSKWNNAQRVYSTRFKPSRNYNFLISCFFNAIYGVQFYGSRNKLSFFFVSKHGTRVLSA